MKFNARVAAAIDCLDAIAQGQPAGSVLTHWGRTHRFAGSGDRSAIRDLVFDALRRNRSFGHLGGAETGRGLMAGWCLDAGHELAQVFSGVDHAPAVLTPGELIDMGSARDMSFGVQYDWPDWLLPETERSLGDDIVPVLSTMQHRAPVFLRVNILKSDLDHAAKVLAGDEIETTPVSVSPLALKVTKNPRRVAGSKAYKDGLVELQDAASQSVVNAVSSCVGGSKVLDFCAGGGGKTLALAAYEPKLLIAHDVDETRMRDLPVRLARAGAQAQRTSTAALSGQEGQFDLVFVDAPCSGSGSWRRDPEGKWNLTPERLKDLKTLQKSVLSKASVFVRPGGLLVYVTCSLLACENQDQASWFGDSSDAWTEFGSKQYLPSASGDGFFEAHFKRVS